MRILDRYIAITLFRGYIVVLLILVCLFSFLALVQELDEVGHDNYKLVDAAFYVALTLPQRILDLASITALLGGLLGLGMLARGNELIAMLTSGVALHRFAWSVGKPVIVLTTGCALFSQFVVPPMQQLAEKQRINPTGDSTSMVNGNGFWSRDRHQVLHVRSMWKGQIPYQIELYEFNPKGRLTRYLQAERADVLDAHHWELMNVHQKIFMDNAIRRESREKMIWRSFLGSQQLEAIQLPAKSLSPLSLYEYVRYLKQTQQPSARFEVVLWQKLFMPLNVGVMALLAVPFGLTLMRRNHIGQQLLLGAGIGMLLFMFNQIMSNLGMITGFSPPLINAFPLATIAGLTGALFWRVARKGVVSTYL
jgi:lipopolysaccharide export system permease protein